MPATRPLSVLVVDDDADTADSAAEVLTLHGFDVRVAGSAAEAERVVAAAEPDVVLMDVRLPDGDGYDLARRLWAATGPRPLLVAVTGRPDAEGRSRDAGFDVHLVKPADPLLLAELLLVYAAESGYGPGPARVPALAVR